MFRPGVWRWLRKIQCFLNFFWGGGSHTRIDSTLLFSIFYLTACFNISLNSMAAPVKWVVSFLCYAGFCVLLREVWEKARNSKAEGSQSRGEAQVLLISVLGVLLPVTWLCPPTTISGHFLHWGTLWNYVAFHCPYAWICKEEVITSAPAGGIDRRETYFPLRGSGL